jgi:CBS domain-containing protein
MKLSDIFTREVVSARADETLAALARLMQERHVGSVVVVEDRHPVGIVTDRDLALALGARGLSPEATAREVMSCHVLAVPDDSDVFTVTRYLRDGEVRRLPIVDRDDRLVGMVSLDDVLGRLGRELFNLAEGIRHEVRVN